jgi:hypothetical protein
MIEVAREVGELGLERRDILGAWPYFRAIGETSKIAAAIESLQGEEGSDAIIEIALQEGVHPCKGLEFILARHGMCRAITCFGMYPIRSGRADCINLLVRNLHAEIVDRIGTAIESQEGVKPDARSIPELISGRDWLFGEYDTYVDTSHLLSLLPYSVETSDRAVLELFRQLCEYGKHLSAMFQSSGQPPFEQPFIDYGHYVEARLGMNVEDHVLHFRRKLAESDPEEAGTAPAEVLVNLLVELHRYSEALDVSVNSLSDQSLRLCHLAGNYARMRELAREKGDSLSYLAATVLAHPQPK